MTHVLTLLPTGGTGRADGTRPYLRARAAAPELPPERSRRLRRQWQLDGSLRAARVCERARGPPHATSGEHLLMSL